MADTNEGPRPGGATFTISKPGHPDRRSRLKVRAGPCGVHLFDRSTGRNVLLEEVRVPPSLWSLAPRQVSVALTNACDLVCSYCYAPKKPAVLDFERAVTWLCELDRTGCLGVGFGGGEPTLYRRFAELCQYAARMTELAVTFTTHAHHLNDALLKALAGNVHFVRVSMDGVGATYEVLRGRSFSALRSRMEDVRRLAPLGINFVVNAQTLPDLDAATAIAARVGASEFLLLPEQPVEGRAGIDPRTARALCNWVRGYRGDVPLTVTQAGAHALPTNDGLWRETGLRAYAHIDASGVLKRSSYDREGIQITDQGVLWALNVLRIKDGEENA